MNCSYRFQSRQTYRAGRAGRAEQGWGGGGALQHAVELSYIYVLVVLEIGENVTPIDRPNILIFYSLAEIIGHGHAWVLMLRAAWT